MNVSVRGVNEKLFKELKSEAAREGTSIATAMNLAISQWIASRKTKKQKLRFLDFKPWDWGPGSEHVSRDVDKLLYGDNLT